MVRWKDIIVFIAILYILGLLALGVIIMILMGPGEIYAYDLGGGRTHPDLHYHTIYPEWTKLWVTLGFYSLPALLVFHFFIPKEESSNLD